MAKTLRTRKKLNRREVQRQQKKLDRICRRTGGPHDLAFIGHLRRGRGLRSKVERCRCCKREITLPPVFSPRQFG